MKKQKQKTATIVPAPPEGESTQAPVQSDPTQLDIANMPVEIDGKTYSLSFEFRDLAESERFFRQKGHRANLILALPDFGLESVREVFACAAHKRHPELSWEAAQALVTMKSVYSIATIIQQVWNAESVKNAAQAAR